MRFVACGKIGRYLAGLDQAAFLADDKTIDAVVWNLEIVGEAAKQLPANSGSGTLTSRGVRSQDCATASCTIRQESILKSSGIFRKRPCRISCFKFGSSNKLPRSRRQGYAVKYK